MSKLIIITPGMHKIAEFCIKVKYRRPGNVVEYLPVEFEVFIDHGYYRAVPLQSLEMKLLTNLPKELTFEIRGGKICNCKKGAKEIVEDIVSKLAEMELVSLGDDSVRKSAVKPDPPQPRVDKKETAVLM